MGNAATLCKDEHWRQVKGIRSDGGALKIGGCPLICSKASSLKSRFLEETPLAPASFARWFPGKHPPGLLTRESTMSAGVSSLCGQRKGKRNSLWRLFSRMAHRCFAVPAHGNIQERLDSPPPLSHPQRGYRHPNPLQKNEASTKRLLEAPRDGVCDLTLVCILFQKTHVFCFFWLVIVGHRIEGRAGEVLGVSMSYRKLADTQQGMME